MWNEIDTSDPAKFYKFFFLRFTPSRARSVRCLFLRRKPIPTSNGLTYSFGRINSWLLFVSETRYFDPKDVGSTRPRNTVTVSATVKWKLLFGLWKYHRHTRTTVPKQRVTMNWSLFLPNQIHLMTFLLILTFYYTIYINSIWILIEYVMYMFLMLLDCKVVSLVIIYAYIFIYNVPVIFIEKAICLDIFHQTT